MMKLIQFFPLFFCVFLMGCSSDKPDGFPKVYSATMSVLKDGKAYSDFKVVLEPVEGQFRWSVGGDPDSAGRISFTTVQGSHSVKGIPAGEFVVTLTCSKFYEIPIPDNIAKLPPEEQQRYVAEKQEEMRLADSKKNNIPKELTQRDTSPIRWSITSNGANELTVDLDKY